MIAPREFAQRWGGTLQRPSADALARLPVGDDDRRFLQEAGLPATAGPSLAFDFHGRLPMVRGARGEGVVRHPRIGTRARAAVCLEPSGAVVTLAAGGAARVLVNSSVGRLAESLLAYRDVEAPLVHREEALMDRLRATLAGDATEAPASPAGLPSPETARRAREEEEARLRASLDAAAEALSRIDPVTFAEPGSLWPAALRDLARANDLDWTPTTRAPAAP